MDVNGVGYKVAIPGNELAELKTGQELCLFTHLSVSERAQDLYGSREAEVIDWFKLLLHVKSIGPKSALQILSKAEPKDLAAAIANESVDALDRLGISKKIAERIVLELKSRAKSAIAQMGEVASVSELSIDTESLQALEALGYSREQAREALRESGGDDVESRVRGALRILGRR